MMYQIAVLPSEVWLNRLKQMNLIHYFCMGVPGYRSPMCLFLFSHRVTIFTQNHWGTRNCINVIDKKTFIWSYYIFPTTQDATILGFMKTFFTQTYSKSSLHSNLWSNDCQALRKAKTGVPPSIPGRLFPSSFCLWLELLSLMHHTYWCSHQ